MTYGIQALYRFPTRTRQELVNYTVLFDPGRQPKAWVDPDATDDSKLYDYLVFNPQAKTAEEVFKTMSLLGHEARTYNLPGVPKYAPYVVPPTRAMRGAMSLNPIYMSMEADAKALMTELGGSSLADEGDAPGFPVTYPSDEQRRFWVFNFKGKFTNVGALINEKNKLGIGAPGAWDLNGEYPRWVSAPIPPSGEGGDDAPNYMPVPVRPLAADEKLVRTMFGWEIYKGDDAPVSTSGVSAEQFASLYQLSAENNALLKKIVSALRLAE